MISLYFEKQKMDLADNFTVNFTYQQVDLSAPEAKINSYTKTVTLYGTPNNNTVLGNIYRFDRIVMNSGNYIGADFDANKRIKFTMLKDDMLFEEGYAKLDSIQKNNDLYLYSFTLYGGVGDLFYSLQTDDNGELRTLDNIYFGFKKLDGNKLKTFSKEQEENNNLFEFNKDFIIESWYRRCDYIKKNGEINNYEFENTDDLLLTKFICPIPVYNGFYTNFDANKVLVQNTGLKTDICNPPQRDKIEDVNGTPTVVNIYGSADGWTLVELPRKVCEYEINDIRSHYQRVGYRLKTIYDKIKDPENNGGYIIDDSNVQEIEKEYIKNAYLMNNGFDWEELNANFGHGNLIPEWDPAFTQSENGQGIINFITVHDYLAPQIKQDHNYAQTKTIDLSDFISPQGVVYIMPEIFMQEGYTQNLYTRAYYHCGNDLTSTYDKVTSGQVYTYVVQESLQYFWLEAYDLDGNLLKTSDFYFYGDYHYDESNVGTYKNVNNSEDLHFNMYADDTVMMLEYKNVGNNKYHAPNDNMDGPWSQILQKEGKKCYSTDQNKLKNYRQTYTDKEGPNTTKMNLLNAYKGYDSYNGRNDRWVGKYVRLYIDISKFRQPIKIKLKADSITVRYQYYRNPTWCDPNLQVGTPVFFYNGGNDYEHISHGFIPYIGGNIYSQRIVKCGTWYLYKMLPTNGGYKASEFLTNIIHISGGTTDGNQTSIYDGQNESTAKQHNVTKKMLFNTENTLYDYLINLGRIFDWRFVQDQRTGTIKIYSRKNYYINEVVDINGDVDLASYKIIPHTAEHQTYSYELNKPETYFSKIWNNKYKNDYGKYKKKTQYAFGDEDYKVLEQCNLQQCLPYLHTSVYYNNEDNKYIRPALGKNMIITGWAYENFANPNRKTFSDSDTVKVNGKLSDITLTATNKISQNVKDEINKLCLFDEKFENISVDGEVLVFFDKLSTANQTRKTYQISDNIQFATQCNENNCYIYIAPDSSKMEPFQPYGFKIYGQREAVIDHDNNQTGYPAGHMDVLPIFNNHYYIDKAGENTYYATTFNNDVQLDGTTSSDMKVYNIYDLCWRRFIDDLYNRDNKVITIKYRLREHPKDAMRKFYTFNNAYWVLNKIDNYNPAVLNSFTNCEFIQVQNIQNYLS